MTAAPATASSPAAPLCLASLVTGGPLCTSAPLVVPAPRGRLLATVDLAVAPGAASTPLGLSATCRLLVPTAPPVPSRVLPTTSLSTGINVLSTVRPCDVASSYHTHREVTGTF